MGTQMISGEVKTFREKMQWEDLEAGWLLVVLGVPFTALAVRHGYGESLQDGDFFLFGISALVAVLFEWFIEQPASRDHFFASRKGTEAPGFTQMLPVLALLGWNFYLFADLPAGHAPWELNLALWLTFTVVVGFHRQTAQQVAERSAAAAARAAGNVAATLQTAVSLLRR